MGLRVGRSSGTSLAPIANWTGRVWAALVQPQPPRWVHVALTLLPSGGGAHGAPAAALQIAVESAAVSTALPPGLSLPTVFWVAVTARTSATQQDAHAVTALQVACTTGARPGGQGRLRIAAGSHGQPQIAVSSCSRLPAAVRGCPRLSAAIASVQGCPRRSGCLRPSRLPPAGIPEMAYPPFEYAGCFRDSAPAAPPSQVRLALPRAPPPTPQPWHPNPTSDRQPQPPPRPHV
jgi:hypothetical protein